MTFTAIVGLITTILSVLSSLIALWKGFQSAQAAHTTAVRNDESQALNQAVDQLKGAQTEADFDKAQSAITAHLPKP